MNIKRIINLIPVDELDLETQKELVKNNLSLRDIVANCIYENNCDYLTNEILSGAPFFWEFSAVYSTRVDFESRRNGYYMIKWDDIAEWIERVNRDYGFLYDSEFDPLELAKQAERLQEKLDNADCGYMDLSDLNYSRIEKKVSQIREKLENAIKAGIDSVLDSTDDLDYILEEIEIINDYCFYGLYYDADIKQIYKIDCDIVA